MLSEFESYKNSLIDLRTKRLSLFGNVGKTFIAITEEQ